MKPEQHAVWPFAVCIIFSSGAGVRGDTQFENAFLLFLEQRWKQQREIGEIYSFLILTFGIYGCGSTSRGGKRREKKNETVIPEGEDIIKRQ